MGSIPKSV